MHRSVANEVLDTHCTIIDHYLIVATSIITKDNFDNDLPITNNKFPGKLVVIENLAELMANNLK